MRRVRGVLAAMLVAAAVLVAPGQAWAQSAQDKENIDARLDGYERKVAVGTNGTSPTWMVFVGLIIFGCAGMFKNAKREPNA